MYRKRFDEMNCAAAQALEQIGDWWTLLLVREAFYGTTTFSGFLERLGIARNVLAERLKRLVELGIFRREQPKPGVERYTYHLTDKGHDLLPTLVALMQWGDKWVFDDSREPVRILDSVRHRPIRKLSVTAADGRPLDIGDLRFRSGPGADKRTLERFTETKRRRAASKD
jgi:DNA-binding HxlR family transcriptional regulator